MREIKWEHMLGRILQHDKLYKNNTHTHTSGLGYGWLVIFQPVIQHNPQIIYLTHPTQLASLNRFAWVGLSRCKLDKLAAFWFNSKTQGHLGWKLKLKRTCSRKPTLNQSWRWISGCWLEKDVSSRRPLSSEEGGGIASARPWNYSFSRGLLIRLHMEIFCTRL